MAKRVHDVAGEARTLERFEFVALLVARCTARKSGREACGGLQVRKTGAGWVYGFNGLAVLCAPCSAAKLVDAIRRTPLNHYVLQAEQFRVDVHLAGAA